MKIHQHANSSYFFSGNRILILKSLSLVLGILFLSAVIYLSINVANINVAQAAVDCSTPVTTWVRDKDVTFSHCYGREFTHSGTEYDLRVYYVESPDQNFAINDGKCATTGSSRCEHAIAVNDDGSGNNATVVAVADEMETAMRFYLDQDLDFIPGTSLDVYIAEDNRTGGVSFANSYIYIDDDYIDNNDSLAKRMLAFHEMQHLVQGEYDSSWHDWYGEGVARAIEDRVDPGLDADTGHLFIPDVNKVLSSATRRAGDIVSASYDSNMWWTWLMDQYASAADVSPVLGWGWLKNFYETLETMSSDEVGAVSDSIESEDSSFRDDFIDYSLALWAYKYNPVDPRLDFLDAEIKGPATAGLSGHTVLTAGPPFPDVYTPAMNPRSVRHWEYDPANQCEFVSFVFDGLGKEYGFSVLTAAGGSLQDRWTVYATDFARTVRGVDLDRILGAVTAFDQSGNVSVSTGCVDPSIDIKSPSTSSFIMVGNADNPRSFIVRLTVDGESGSSVAGLVASDFSVNLIDGASGLRIPSVILNSAYVLDDYWLLVQAPTDSDGVSTGSFYDLEVVLGSPASPHDTDSESLAVLYVERQQDVEIILDNSGSMGESGAVKLEAAQNAAALLTELLEDNDQVGYINFNSTASIVESLDELGSGDGSHRQDVLQAILDESAGGLTAIGDGMIKAAADHDVNQGVGPPPNMCSFVLLSDGQETAAPYWEDASSDVLDNGCSIHTVAFGPEANEMLMQAIAGSSDGGSYDYATSSGNVPINSTLQWDNNLSRVYDSVAQRVAGRERITTQVQSSSIPGKGISADFDDLKAQSVFSHGEKFVTQGLQVTVGPHPMPSRRGRDGLAIVSDTSEAGGIPLEMLLSRAALDFSLQDIPSDELSFRYANGGGSVSLSINGFQATQTEFDSLNGKTIEDVSISVISTGKNTGTLYLEGPIKKFSVGGEKLYLDNVAIGDVGDTHVIPVDDSSDELVVVIAWQDDTFGSHETILSEPNGNLVPNSFKQTGDNGTNEIWRVQAPKEGKYRLVIKNLDQEYFITGSVISDYRMVVITGNPIEDMNQGARVPIVASLTGPDGVLSGATVHARVIDPNGDIADVILHDNGSHGDGAHSDGVYANWYTATSYSDLMLSPGQTKDGLFEPAVTGSYVVRVYATWKDIKREGESSFAIGPALDSGNGLPDLWEEANGLDPSDTAAERKDPDFDGLSNLCEFRIGTNPSNSDTDGGGESDGSELSDPADCVLGDLNPLDPSDDRTSPLNFVQLVPQASVQQPFFEIMIDKPQNGPKETFVDVYRQAVNVGTGIAGEWVTKASDYPIDASPVFVDYDVELGYRYQYIVLPWFTDLETSSRVEMRGEFTPSVESSADPYEPHGNVLINGGQLTTNSRFVDLDISLTDDGLGHGHIYFDYEKDVMGKAGTPHGQLLMRISNSSDFGSIENVSWIPYDSEIHNWDLGPVKSGERKFVYVQVKDEAGNINTRLIYDDITFAEDGDKPDISSSSTPSPNAEVSTPAVSSTPSPNAEVSTPAVSSTPSLNAEVSATAVSSTPTQNSVEISEDAVSGFSCTNGGGGKSSAEGIVIGFGLILIFGYLKGLKWRRRAGMENKSYFGSLSS